MEEVLPSVHRILPSKQTPTKYISFLVTRDRRPDGSGNLLFPCFGSHSSIESSFDAIEALGGITHQLLGDMHFAAKYNDDVFARFGAKTHCSEVEAPDVQRKVEHVEVFAFESHDVVDGVTAIPTPGHRPGAVGYLVAIGGRRHLFAGDTLYHDGNRWRCFTSKRNRKTMLATLDMLAGIPFHVLLANTRIDNPVCHVDLDTDSRRALLEAIKSAT